MAGLNYYDYTYPEYPDYVFSYWKYDNYGTADLLSTSGTTVTNLPFSQSKSGSAFFQTAAEKCFDIPETNEIWVKFDVYSSLTGGFGAYDWYDNSPYEDEESGSITFPAPNWGIRANTDGSLEILNESVVATYPNVFVRNQRQTILLHARNNWYEYDELEIWVDGTKIATYSCDINDIEHFFLKTDDANTYFSNVIISERELTFDDNAEGVPWEVSLNLDILRRVETSDTKLFDTTLDTERQVVCSYDKNFDTARKIAPYWRYENFGNAFLLAVEGGTTVADLPEEQSKTGSAYQIGGGTNIFGLQPTDEIWARFDVYLKDDDSIYANNFDNNVWNGIRINGYSSNATFLEVLAVNIRSGVWGSSYTQYRSGTLTGFHSVLLHMISDAQFGKVQLWVDDADNPIFDYTGGVNYGNNFTNFFIACARETPLISNVVVSNCPLSFADNATVIGYSFIKNFDTQRDVANAEIERLIYPATKVLLNFDDKEDPFFDCAGNKWTAYNDPKTSANPAKFGRALQLDGTQRLEMRRKIALGGRDFTIDGWFYIPKSGSRGSYGYVCYLLGDKYDTYNYRMRFYVNSADQANFDILLPSPTATYKSTSAGTTIYNLTRENWHHFAICLLHDAQKVVFAIDGKVKIDSLDDIDKRSTFKVMVGGLTNSNNSEYPFRGAIDSFRIIDGVALYTHDFTPPESPMWFKKLSLANDILRNVWGWANFNADTIRQISNKVIIAPAENGTLLDGVENSDVESIEISLNAQQLTDQLTYTTINSVDILQQVQGQYLDYKFNLRVEDTDKQGILTTCRCCSDSDELLYTEVSYEIYEKSWTGGGFIIPESELFETKMGWSWIKNEDGTYQITEPTAKASVHMQKIAEVFDKDLVISFDDFVSSANILQDNLTYNDIISELFGWTSRVPQMLINCYIRDDTIFVIQRGHEQNTVDLTDAKITLPTIHQELVRTMWNKSKWTKDQEYIKTPAKTDWREEFILGDEIPEDEPEEPDEEEPEDEPEEPDNPFAGLNDTTVIEENDVTTIIQYSYYGDGLLSSVTNTVYEENELVSKDITSYSYDGEGSVIETSTENYEADGEALEKVGVTVSKNEYTMVGDQKKLAGELTVEYDDEGEIINSRSVSHGYLPGQTHLHSNSTGSTSGSTTNASSDMRPTPYEQGRSQKDLSDFFNDKGDKLSNSYKSYTYVDGKKIEVLGTETEKGTLTLYGYYLYDTSFPVADVPTLKAITAAINWLNRKIKETVTFDLYDFPHVIDFNDKIIFRGQTYFLESNTVVRTPRITNKQSLKIVRWYQ